ncbi:MAG: hypothetical protein C5S48_09630 [Candidatus Methanogaster sp.]|nr:MAG: hypothetical protein C5S48_09630 [ANME-2 cluster archaeon]
MIVNTAVDTKTDDNGCLAIQCRVTWAGLVSKFRFFNPSSQLVYSALHIHMSDRIPRNSIASAKPNIHSDLDIISTTAPSTILPR